MPTDHRAALKSIRTFPQLIRYLRDEMGWPIDQDSFLEDENLFYDYSPEELGLESTIGVKIESIKRLRRLDASQPWGIFFIKFAPRKLPVVALRRILSSVALKKRASANSAERAAWSADDLLFVSNYGEGDERQISFAHFSQDTAKDDLPVLKVLGWNNLDTPLHLDDVAAELATKLSWPDDASDVDRWRQTWRSAFTLRPGEVIRTSKTLAVELARLARNIRDRIRTVLAVENARGPVTKLMTAFKESLIHDLDAGTFADMYAQTIAYGLLSARIANPKANTADGFASQLPVTNPFLKELMETFLLAGGRRKRAAGAGIDFDELGVNDVVELLDHANMEAVVRDFGDRNPQEDPVIHFYELFLKEFDAKKRMQRGVFYTPRPVVSYIVRSVHELLQTEFGLADGLADTATWGDMAARHAGLKIPDGAAPEDRFVTILDPATGTGTFLVECIDVIHRTLAEKWKLAGAREAEILDRWNDYVPKHLLPRLHGYELLMAPYAIAHLKIGLKLFETGYRFGSDERARIYLTNALEPASDTQLRLDVLPALAHEAQAVNDVKRNQRFTVVVGNPPYAIQSQNLSSTARSWVNAYRFVAGVRISERNALQFEKNIQNDYVKFVRLTEVVVNASGCGLIGMVTSHSFMYGATYRGMRWNLLRSFSKLAVLDVHGNATKREVAPDGSHDENIFDISEGVAISLFTSSPEQHAQHDSYFADLWGERGDESRGKYAWLSSNSWRNTPWQISRPRQPLFLLKPSVSSLQSEYECFPTLPEIMPLYSMGVKTSRDELVLDFDVDALLSRIDRFRSASVPDEVVCEELGIPLKKGWNVRRARRDLCVLTRLSDFVQRFLYHPFDWRLIFYHKSVVFSAADRVMRHLGNRTNLALIATRQTKDNWDIQCARTLVGHKSLGAYDANSVFPLYLIDPNLGQAFEQRKVPNISEAILAHARVVFGRSNAESSDMGPVSVFNYAYALFHAPSYRTRYAEFLIQDFPRLPLTWDPALFNALVRLGSELVALHLMESPTLENFITTYTGPKNPEVARVGWSDGTVWLDAAATKKGQPATPGTIGFRGVPEAVWNFHIGGYQVCEKWLKDRKGRTLTNDDLEHYQKIVVALNETIRLMREIDEVIEAHGGWPGAFATTPKTEYPEAPPAAYHKAASPADEAGSAPADEPKPREETATDPMPIDLFGNTEPAPAPELFAASTEKRRTIFDTTRTEVMAVIREVMTEAGSGGLIREELIHEVARRLKFGRVGARIRESISGDIRAASMRRVLRTEKARMYVDHRSITDYTRDELKDILCTVMGGAWWDQGEAIREAARHLGFRRTGSNIVEAFKSAINGGIRQGRMARDGERVREVKG